MKSTKTNDQRLYEMLWYERRAWEHILILVTNIYRDKNKELKKLETKKRKKK